MAQKKTVQLTDIEWAAVDHLLEGFEEVDELQNLAGVIRKALGRPKADERKAVDEKSLRKIVDDLAERIGDAEDAVKAIKAAGGDVRAHGGALTLVMPDPWENDVGDLRAEAARLHARRVKRENAEILRRGVRTQGPAAQGGGGRLAMPDPWDD